MRISENFGEYVINDGEGTDLVFVQRELSGSYWAKGVPMDIVRRAAENSLRFNVFLGKEQVAYARMITDKATFAYLCDVIVAEPHRGKGIGKALVGFILRHPDLQGLRRILLGTLDAHGLYEKFGFSALEEPQRMMEIRVKDIYTREQK